MLFSKYTSTILYVLMGISVILIAILYMGGNVGGIDGPNAEPKITNVILYWSYVLLLIAAISAVGFPLIYVIIHPTNIKNILIVLGIGVGLYVISRALASDELLNLTNYEGSDNVPSVLKTVGAGLIFTYILLFGAIISIIYSAVASIFK